MRSLIKDHNAPSGPRAKAGRKSPRASRDARRAGSGRRKKLRDDIFSRALHRIGVWFAGPMFLLSLGVICFGLFAGLFASGALGRAANAANNAMAAVIADSGFGISEIHIAGNNRTAPETILAALGFAPGQSIFAADLGSARARLMALDWIASADVQRRYPDAIFVSLVEKRPFALWQEPDGSVAVVERSGAVITTKNIERFARLPKLVGADAPAASAEIVDAVSAHRAVAARVKMFERQSDRRWNLILDDGVVVKLPETGWQPQIDALEHLIIDDGILERDVTEIDLRSPTHYFFVLNGGNKKAVQRGGQNLMGEAIRLRVNNEIPAYRTGLVTALDIGSSKIVCVIGRAEGGSLRILGSALRESGGIKAGTVTSLEQAEESIRDCVAAAENHADARIQNVLISVNCGGPTSVTARAAMTLEGALVSDAHLRALLAEGRTRCRLEGYEIVQSAPTSYVVDEARGVRDPSGMFCQRIGVTMHAVAVKPSPLQNLKLAIERCHLNIVGALFGAYASGLATLTEDEKQIGATVIEMGGGVTGIAVFLEGHMVHADVVPIGGFAVTNDLARMLAAPLSAAERAKTLFGAAMGESETGADVVAVAQMGEEGEDSALRVPRSMLTRIIEARLIEIFEQVQAKLQASGYDVAAGRRAVLTGGACQLAGAREFAARMLNKQVRIGRPQAFPGLAAASAGPDYATSIGLLMAGASMPPELLNPDLPVAPAPRQGGGWLGRLTGRWLG